MRRLIIFLLNFIVVFVIISIVMNILWEFFIDEKLYDCTDAGIGYLSVPGGDWPVVYVKHIVADRPIGDPDMILVGWNPKEIWCMAGAFFVVSLIVSFLAARISWPFQVKKRS